MRWEDFARPRTAESLLQAKLMLRVHFLIDTGSLISRASLQRPLIVRNGRRAVAAVEIYVADIAQHYLIVVDRSGFVVDALRLAEQFHRRGVGPQSQEAHTANSLHTSAIDNRAYSGPPLAQIVRQVPRISG